MPALVIKNLPAGLHRRLKAAARREHRSMTQQAVMLLDHALGDVAPVPDFKPVTGAFPLTNQFIDDAKRWGRA